MIWNKCFEDYISITKYDKIKRCRFFTSDWLKNRNTVEFLGIWEKIWNGIKRHREKYKIITETLLWHK